MGLTVFRRLPWIILAMACTAAFAGPFVPGGPNTRGRVTIDKQAVLSDWGTTLRGACWCQDCHSGIPGRDEFAAIKMAGLNSIHVYAEKNDGVAVGAEAENMDSIVEWCRQESVYVVMTFGNSHLDSWGKVLDFWRFYAPRYKDMTHVVYEAKNEACYGTYHCEEDAMQCYRDAYRIIHEEAPETHVMLMSHSNLQGGIKPLYDDVERLGSEIDWTNSSIAFHGYGTTAGFQEEAAKTLGADGYAMSCTEFPFNGGGASAAAYERAGISYFWFEACWGGARTPGNIKGYLSGTGVSWKPDFGDWPQPHVEHPVAVKAGQEPLRILSDNGRVSLGRFILNNLPESGVSVLYDAAGRILWQGRGKAGVPAGIPSRLGSQVLLVEYLRE